VEAFLREGERLDDLQRNGFQIIQHPGRFCFGMDAVLLSGFAKAGRGELVLDLGTGTGIIPLLMAAKTKAQHLTGLEIQEQSADMARRSVALNGLEARVSIVTGDLKEAGKLFAAASFHVITSNPPYMIGGHGLVNPGDAKAIARHEIHCTLEDVVRETGKLLVEGGKFYLVHRPFRLPEIIQTCMKYRLEPKRMRLVYPYVDKEPGMILLEAVKGGKPRMTVEKPLVLFDAPGVYTKEVQEEYGF
jgi:tRNA1Val (adenine37-N6)-methyltransferase